MFRRSLGVGLRVFTWVSGYNKLKQNEMISNKNKNLVGGDEKQRVILSLPSRFSVICGFCERNVRGMSCRIAFEFPDFMIDAVIFFSFLAGFHCSFVAGGWVAGSMQKS